MLIGIVFIVGILIVINFFYIANDVSKIKKILSKSTKEKEALKKTSYHPALNLDAKECYRMYEEELFLDNKDIAKEYLSRAYFRAQTDSSMKDKNSFLQKCESALETLE